MPIHRGMADTTDNDQTDSQQAIAAGDLDTDTASQEQLDALLAGSVSDTKPAATEPEGVEAQTSDAEQSPEPDDSAEKDQSEDQEQPGAKGKQFRIRARDASEEAFYALIKSGKTPDEAARAVYSEKAKPAAEQPKQAEPEASPFAAIDKEISDKQAELSALEAKLNSATEDADLTKINALNREIARKEREIERATDRRASVAERIEQAKAEETASQAKEASVSDYAKAVEMFPELGDKNSAEHKAFMAFYEKAKATPEYSDAVQSDAPGWRLRMAKDFALEHGLAPAHRRTAASPPAKKAPAPAQFQPNTNAQTKQAIRPQASAARVISSKAAPNGGATAPVFDPSAMGNLSTRDLDALLGSKR